MNVNLIYHIDIFDKTLPAIEITSPELKRQMMLDVFQMLPEPNKSTALAMLSHLVKVNECQNQFSVLTALTDN